MQKVLKRKFRNLAKRFDIKMEVLIHNTEEPGGRGIGPILETRESLYVLEQSRHSGPDLEARSINLAGSLLELCLADSPKSLQEKSDIIIKMDLIGHWIS